MSFDDRKEDFSKEPIYVVEIEADYCENVYGEAPCTAEVGVTGSQKCFNTLISCQDPENYVEEGKVYRFCESRSPHPQGINAIPSLRSVSIAPAQIQIDGGLGVRSSLSLTFDDHPASDLGIDKYVAERDYIALERGTYWTKWRARNPYYQGRKIRIYSGYLVNGVWDVANAQVRHYIIESVDVSGGRCSIKAKDPLKLADNKRAQAPRASTGTLASPIDDVATEMTLEPAGVGDAEYPASGFIRMRAEVVGFTRSGDTFTITRGEYNTTPIAHSAGDTGQLCLLYNDQVNTIVEDLLVNYAGIDAAFIPTATWQAEADDFLSGLLETIITEPVGVSKLLKELGEQAPHNLYWDERTQTVEFNAVKPPPLDARPLTEDENFIADSVSVQDEREMRVSTVYVYFGQIDPTRKLDETNNYSQTYVRADLDSINRYGSNEIKTIYSRWINNDNKAGAVQLAAKIGRRFGTVPRTISFSLDPKDSSVWAGQSVTCIHREITDFTGEPEPTVFQVVSVQESGNYKYQGIEYNYDEALPQDEGGGEPGVDLIIIGGDRNNIDIREIYDGLFPAPDAETKVKIIIESVATIGSTSTATPSLLTGSWPAGALITLENRGRILGHGGDGGEGIEAGEDGTNGGDAISMQYDLSINNLGIIGGGGGGGASDSFAAGGGGAGRLIGVKGTSGGFAEGWTVVRSAQDGSSEMGGVGARLERPAGGETEVIEGGNGGDLGVDGGSTSTSTGGTAGLAIDLNGNTVTYIEAGDIRGTVV